MSEQREMKKIDMETLEKSEKKVSSAKLKKLVFAVIAVLVTTGAAYAAYRYVSGNTLASRFAVNKMNCPACVVTVKEVTEKIPGVLETDVNLAAQEVTVKFRDKQTGPERIKQAITQAGYTVHVDGVFQPGAEQSSGTVVALVNGEPLFKEETTIALAPEKLTADSAKTAENFFNSVGLKILLQEANQKTVVVQPYEVEEYLDKLMESKGRTKEQFYRKAAEVYGSEEKLHQIVARRIAVERLFTDHVLSGVTDAEEKHRKAVAWVGTIFKDSDVKIVDPDFEKQLHEAAGNTDWKIFWPQMIGKETELKTLVLQ